MKISCETGSFHTLCYERLQEICKIDNLRPEDITICAEDKDAICNEISRRYFRDDEIENYCNKLLQKNCTINLQDYCKQFFKYV